MKSHNVVYFDLYHQLSNNSYEAAVQYFCSVYLLCPTSKWQTDHRNRSGQAVLTLTLRWLKELRQYPEPNRLSTIRERNLP